MADIAAAVRGLAARGVVFLRFGRMDQDRDGIWTAPGGDKVAWFADPDGNILSLTQFLYSTNSRFHLPPRGIPPIAP